MRKAVCLPLLKLSVYNVCIGEGGIITSWSVVSGDAVIQQWIVSMAAAVAGTTIPPPRPTVTAAATVGTTPTIPSSSPAAATAATGTTTTPNIPPPAPTAAAAVMTPVTTPPSRAAAATPAANDHSFFPGCCCYCNCDFGFDDSYGHSFLGCRFCCGCSAQKGLSLPPIACMVQTDDKSLDE